MGFYQDQIVPLLINLTMRRRDLAAYRSRSIYHGASTQTLVGHLWLSENLCGFRILVLLRGFYGNARHKPYESNEADRYQVIAAPPLMHRKGHASSGDQQCHHDDHAICEM